MTKFVLMAALFTLVLGTSMAPATAQDQCHALEVYFSEVDRAMGEGFLPVLQDEEWRAQLEASTAKASRSDMGILVLSPEEMEPFVRLMAVPGDALLTIPEDETPPIARDLHESALEIWLLYPPMFRALASGGLFGTMIFLEEFEEQEAANLKAQAAVEAACPAQVANLRARSENASQMESMMDIDDPSAFEDLDAEDFEGSSYSVLFFTSEDAGDSIPELPGDSATQEPTGSIEQTPASKHEKPTSEPMTITTARQGERERSTSVTTEHPGTAVESAIAPDMQVRVIEGPLNMRARASTKSDIVATLDTGAILDVLSGPEDGEGYIWWQVSDERGNIGWLPDEFIEPVQDTASPAIMDAAEALTYYSYVLPNLRYQEVEGGDIGTSNRMLVQPQQDGDTTVALYIQQDPVLPCIAGFAPAGDPTADVPSAAKAMQESRTCGRLPTPATPARSRDRR